MSDKYFNVRVKSGFPHKLIPTQKHEFFFSNVINPTSSIITIPDSGTIGGIDLSNPASTNKPTFSTAINQRTSYIADGTTDYIYKAETDFMRNMTSWMITFVFKFDGGNNQLLSAHSETNVNIEGWLFSVQTERLRIESWNAAGVYTAIYTPFTFTSGQNYIFTCSYDGTTYRVHNQTTQITVSNNINLLIIPSETDNVSIFARIRSTGNFFGSGNVAYVGIDEYNLTKLNNNVAVLKNYYDI